MEPFQIFIIVSLLLPMVTLLPGLLLVGKKCHHEVTVVCILGKRERQHEWHRRGLVDCPHGILSQERDRWEEWPRM